MARNLGYCTFLWWFCPKLLTISSQRSHANFEVHLLGHCNAAVEWKTSKLEPFRHETSRSIETTSSQSFAIFQGSHIRQKEPSQEYCTAGRVGKPLCLRHLTCLCWGRWPPDVACVGHIGLALCSLLFHSFRFDSLAVDLNCWH